MIQKNILLLFTFSLLLLNSCGNDTPKDKLNDIKKDASNFEDGVSSALAYNDGIISELALMDLKFMELNSYIENGPDENYPETYAECVQEHKRIYDVVNKVAPFGIGASDFKNAALDYLNAYGDFLDFLAPEKWDVMMDESSDEISELSLGFAEAYTQFENELNRLNDAQQIFAKKNDFRIDDEEYDLEKIYEETK